MRRNRLAALILTVLSWEWIFLLIVPLGLVGGALAWNTLPGPVEQGAVLLDRRGTALLTVVFVALVLAVGWLSAGSIVMLAIAIAATVVNGIFAFMSLLLQLRRTDSSRRRPLVLTSPRCRTQAARPGRGDTACRRR